MQGARRGTGSWVSRITSWAEVGAKQLSHPGCPGNQFYTKYSRKIEEILLGAARWLSGLAPPSAQDVILETQDPVPRRAPCMEPTSPSAYVSASLCVPHE